MCEDILQGRLLIRGRCTLSNVCSERHVFFTVHIFCKISATQVDGPKYKIK